MIEPTRIVMACLYQWFQISDSLIRKRSRDSFVDERFSFVIPHATMTMLLLLYNVQCFLKSGQDGAILNG